MKKSRYTEEQIVGALKESEARLETGELCRRHGISRQTFYRWKAKFGGLEVSDAQRLRQLEEENRKLKQLVAEQALDRWAYENGVTLHFITPGRPMENGYIESFRGRFREECLNEHWFLTLDDARETIENWRFDYNRVRPHSSLGYPTPEEFATGYANVESTKRFPHSRSPGGGGIISLLNSTASTLTYLD